MLGRVPSIQFSMAYKMWFGLQFHFSDSSNDDLYRLDLDVQVENDLFIAGIILWCTLSSRGCLRVRPDANADANRSKIIC